MSQHDAVPGLGDIVADKYQVVGLLGTGGMGAVLEASHVVTGKRFAIKWLLPNAGASAVGVQRFVREAQVAGRVQHTNIVEVYDIGREGNSSYMVMELLQGVSLQTYLTERGRLPVSEAIGILLPVLRGVIAAHRAGVVHRDLKPDNIFLSNPPPGSEGERIPKILDFGISKLTERSGPSPALTHAGAVMGTPYYMAPEQMRGDQVDQCADVYALGVILYQMVSGQLPYEAESFPDLVVKVTTEEPAALESLRQDLPSGFAAIVARAMSKDRAGRYPSVEALQTALAQYDTKRMSSRPPSVPPRLQQPSTPTPVAIEAAPLTLETPLSLATHHPRHPSDYPRRSGWPVIGAVGAVLIAVVGVIVVTWPGEQAPAEDMAAATSSQLSNQALNQAPNQLQVPNQPPADRAADQAPSRAPSTTSPSKPGAGNTAAQQASVRQQAGGSAAVATAEDKNAATGATDSAKVANGDAAAVKDSATYHATLVNKDQAKADQGTANNPSAAAITDPSGEAVTDQSEGQSSGQSSTIVDGVSPAAQPGHVSEDLRKLLESMPAEADDDPTHGGAGKSPTATEEKSGATQPAADDAHDGQNEPISEEAPTEAEPAVDDKPEAQPDDATDEEQDDADLTEIPVKKDDGSRSGVDLDLGDF